MPLIRRSVKKKLREQGTGRHTVDEVVAMGQADLAAIAELLGAQDFLFGACPRTADATLFAFTEATLGFPLDSPLRQAARSHANLVAYRERVRARWWKELAAAA
jgi:glutathione S-transferase